MRLAAFGMAAILVVSGGLFADDDRKENGAPMARPQTCAGEKCLTSVLPEVVTNCDICGKPAEGNGCKLCHACANATDRCYKCGLPLATPGKKIVAIGSLSLVDKQPDPDMDYFVFQGEDGTRRGLYLDPRRPVVQNKGGVPRSIGRAAIKAYDTQNDTVKVVVRELFPLAGFVNDRKVSGKSDVAVHWRIGGIEGPDVEPKDGSYELTLPAATTHDVEVVAGKKVIETWTFDGKEWEKK